MIDLAGGSAETHLGRFFSDFTTGNSSAASQLIVRKALNNYNYVSQTPYTWLAIAIAGALAALRWLGDRPLVQTLTERPGAAAALLGVIVGGVAALLTEDSGIVMPALMLFAGAMPILYVTLDSGRRTNTQEPATGTPDSA